MSGTSSSTSTSTSYIVLTNKKMLKAGVAGIIAAAADNVIMKNPNLKNCALFGAASAAGILGVSVFIEDIMTMLPATQALGTYTKGIEQRVIETICGAGAAYAINNFIIKTPYTTQQMLPKLAIITVADVLAETAADAWMGDTIDLFLSAY